MMILAKIALTGVGTLALAGMYTFSEGTIRVDVDEHHSGGAHVHFWVPAKLAPMALHFVPDDKLREATEHAEEWYPVLKAVAQSLKEHPDVNFVEVQDGEQHVQVQTRGARLHVDVVDTDENVHVAVPISTIEDVAEQIASRAPRQ